MIPKNEIPILTRYCVKQIRKDSSDLTSQNIEKLVSTVLEGAAAYLSKKHSRTIKKGIKKAKRKATPSGKSHRMKHAHVVFDPTVSPTTSSKPLSTLHPDTVYPYHSKDVVAMVNKAITNITINQHDVVCIKKVYDIVHKPEFIYISQFGAPQYSQRFIEWLIKQYDSNPYFFDRARKKYNSLPSHS